MFQQCVDNFFRKLYLCHDYVMRNTYSLHTNFLLIDTKGKSSILKSENSLNFDYG